MFPGYVLLRATPTHAGATAIAFGTVGRTISAHARAVQVADVRVIGVPGFLVADGATTGNESVVATVTAIWCDARTVAPSIGILDATIATDQAVITIATTIGTVVNTSVSTDESVVAIMTAIRLIVRIGARDTPAPALCPSNFCSARASRPHMRPGLD